LVCLEWKPPFPALQGSLEFSHLSPPRSPHKAASHPSTVLTILLGH
jgi:hypothetical protein